MTNFKELVNLVYLLISFTSSCGELFYYNLCISFVVNFVIHKNMHYSSGVASPKFFWGPKNLWGPKCLTLGEKQYFVWNTASQSTK